jgi:hypothetical protein
MYIMCTFPYVPILLCVRMGVLYSKICVDSLLSLLPVSRERGDVKWGTQAIQEYEVTCTLSARGCQRHGQRPAADECWR